MIYVRTLYIYLYYALPPRRRKRVVKVHVFPTKVVRQRQHDDIRTPGDVLSIHHSIILYVCPRATRTFLLHVENKRTSSK